MNADERVRETSTKSCNGNMDLSDQFDEILEDSSTMNYCVFEKVKGDYKMKSEDINSKNKCVNQYRAIFKYPMSTLQKKAIVCSFKSDSNSNSDRKETCICSIPTERHSKHISLKCLCNNTFPDCPIMRSKRKKPRNYECSKFVSRNIVPYHIKDNWDINENELFIGTDSPIRNELNFERKFLNIIKPRNFPPRKSFSLNKNVAKYIDKRAIPLNNPHRNSIKIRKSRSASSAPTNASQTSEVTTTTALPSVSTSLTPTTTISTSLIPTTTTTTTTTTTPVTKVNDIVSLVKFKGYNIAIGLSTLSVMIIVTCLLYFLWSWYRKRQKRKYVNRRRIRPPRITDDRRGNYHR